MSGDGERRPLPVGPVECRRRAEDADQVDEQRAVWALLAIAGELAEIRRELRRRR